MGCLFCVGAYYPDFTVAVLWHKPYKWGSLHEAHPKYPWKYINLWSVVTVTECACDTRTKQVYNTRPLNFCNAVVSLVELPKSFTLPL